MPSRSTRDREDREARRRSRVYTARQRVHVEQGRRRHRDNLLAAVAFTVVVVLAVLAQIGFFTLGPGRAAPSPTPDAGATTTPDATTTPGATPAATASPAPSAGSG